MLLADVTEPEIKAITTLASKSPLNLSPAGVLVQYISLRSDISMMDKASNGAKWKEAGGQKGQWAADHRALYKSIFTEKELYAGRADLVFLLEHLILKGGVESVCESMGSLVKGHAEFSKSHDLISKEVCVHWNTPPAYAPGVEGLVSRATKGISFVRTSQRGLVDWEISKVVDRVRRADPMAALYCGGHDAEADH